MRFRRKQKYRISDGVVRYLCGLPDPDAVKTVSNFLSRAGVDPDAYAKSHFAEDESELVKMAKDIIQRGNGPEFCRGVVIAEEPHPVRTLKPWKARSCRSIRPRCSTPR